MSGIAIQSVYDPTNRTCCLNRCAATGTMGIKQLFQIIKDEAPEAIKEGDIKNQFGRKVAIVSDPRSSDSATPR